LSSPAAFCARHPTVPAEFRCDGCERKLCRECVAESHALFLCKVCGERALPLATDRAPTVRAHRRAEAIARPYPLASAFAYAFRGLGKFMFAATLIAMAFVEFVLVVGWGCLPFLLAIAFWALVVGLQFQIVRTTAEGDDELPDWPEYFDWSERLGDVATYLWVGFLQFAPLVAYASLFAGRRLVTGETTPAFWFGAAVVGWFGCGVALFAFAAAALEGGGAALRIDRHVHGFFAARGDALAVTNLTFGLGIAAFLSRSLVERLPLFGAAVSGTLGAYWLFTSAHLVGVLVRRRRALFRELYS